MAVKTPVYMDYQATTPLDPRVLDAMMPYLTDRFGNPHSVGHRFGWEAEAGVDKARGDVATLIGAAPEDIVFTSGATETNNLVLKGVMAAYGAKRDHLVTVVTEHKCVLEAAASVARAGFQVTLLPVGGDGLIDLDRLADSLTDRTALVSVMTVNNEIGVIQPIARIGALCRERGVLFHTDAAQAFGKLPLDVADQNIDLMSISGHKIHGPKGIGALYLRRRPRIRLVPQMDGGGQERGIRSGTLSPALCAGLGTAASIAGAEMARDGEHVARLMGRFRSKLVDALPGVVVNGHTEQRYPGNLNLSFPGLDGELLIANLRDLAVSSGAACASATTGPSYVLEAIGVPEELAAASIRFGIGRFTTEAEIDFAAERVIETVAQMGGLSAAPELAS